MKIREVFMKGLIDTVINYRLDRYGVKIPDWAFYFLGKFHIGDFLQLKTCNRYDPNTCIDNLHSIYKWVAGPSGLEIPLGRLRVDDYRTITIVKKCPIESLNNPDFCRKLFEHDIAFTSNLGDRKYILMQIASESMSPIEELLPNLTKEKYEQMQKITGKNPFCLFIEELKH